MQRYAITDRMLLPDEPNAREASLRVQVEAWAKAGVEWVQLREKDLGVEELAAMVKRLAPVVRTGPGRTRLVVNALPAGVALGSGAHGVHLAGGAASEAIRAARGAGACVTVSCHTLDEIAAARDGGADAVLWAPVFGKAVHGVGVLAGTGLEALSAAVTAAQPVPVFALGGVTAENAAVCLRAGAAGIAGIRLFHGESWRRI